MVEQSRTEFEQRLIDKASADSTFREKLKSDPKGAINELMGMDLPDELSITVHEEDESTLHFVLPPAGDELNSAEMVETVGGICWDHCGCEKTIAETP